MSDKQNAIEKQNYYKNLFNQYCQTQYGIEINNDSATIPPDHKKWFLDEEKIKIHKGISHGFFWQRLSSFIKRNSPVYYRISLPGNLFINETGLQVKPDINYLAFFLRIQYESHDLIEEPLAVITEGKEVQVLDLDKFFKFLGAAEPAKIYFSEDDYQQRLATVKNSLKDILADSIKEKQQQMVQTLTDEFHMIREYYSHLLSKVKKAEDREHYVEEQKRLESEKIRKLHPSSLKLIATPEIINSIKIVS
ncbi:MAG: hypothetical protein PF689_03365 [Deltaproteobacteria bacterium]|jgi:hypothetical protein|nr:hypothetical protein [Deltaproteobacteria bacterium]